MNSYSMNRRPRSYKPISNAQLEGEQRSRRHDHGVERLPRGFTRFQTGRTGYIYFKNDGDRVLEAWLESRKLKANLS